MFVGNILHKQRKTEPTSVHILRAFSITTFLVLTLSYSGILIFNICNDTPILRNWSREEDAIPVPDLVFRPADPNYYFDCVYLNYADMDNPPNCTDFFTKKQYSQANTTLDILSFHAPELKIAMVGNTDPSYIIYLTIAFNISTQMMIFDVDYNYFRGTEESLWDNDLFTQQSKFMQSLAISNLYSINLEYADTLFFSRSIKRVIKPSFKGYLGIPPDYEDRYFIDSKLLYAPSSIAGAAIVTLNLQSYIVNVQEEQRTYTILGSLGIIGGAWGFAAGFYAFLFGADKLRPWGTLQNNCCGISRKAKNKLNRSLQAQSLESTNEHDKAKEIVASTQEQIDEMQRKINVMNMIIHEYIIDMDYLEKQI